MFEYSVPIEAPAAEFNGFIHRRILAILLVFLLLTCITIWFDIPYLRQFLGLISLLAIPGFLITMLFNFECDSFWGYLVMSLGLSVAFLMLMGFLLNQVFILFKLPHPLTPTNLIALVVGGCLIMGGFIWFQRQGKTLSIRSEENHSTHWFSFLVPLTFPVLGAAGAITLNNGGSNLLPVILLISMSVYVLLLCWNHKQISGDLLASVILLTGLGMLFSYSLRSWHISGWDIHQEFFVYQLTKFHQEWQIDFFKDPYNSSLSLTILPTILNSFLGINDEYLFKVVYPFIFAWVPLIIYLTARKYVTSLLAFLASIFFIFQPWFIQPAPALARQEIGLLFFALFIWVSFNHRFTTIQRTSLQILFGMAIVTSHYSTAYIALMIAILTYLLSFFLRIFTQGRKHSWPKKTLSEWVLLLLCAFTIYWSSIQTGTSGNVSFVFQITLQNLKNALVNDLRSEDMKLAFLRSETNFDIQDVNRYIKSQNEIYSQNPDLYPKETYKDFPPEIVLSPVVGGAINDGMIRTYVSTIFFGIKQLTKILLIIGAILWPYYSFRRKYSEDELVILNTVTIGFLLLWIFLPILSLYYNLFRVYLQTLVISSVSMIMGLNFLFIRLKKQRTRTFLISLLVVIFFYSTNGLAPYFVGGPANLNLNNYGTEYDKFYTHPQEVASAAWLAHNRDTQLRVYADDTASLRLISFGNGNIFHDTAVLPSTITRGSYVYLDYANISGQIAEAHVAGKQISYRYPLLFLEKNKNLIYDNGGSRIYR